LDFALTQQQKAVRQSFSSAVRVRRTWPLGRVTGADSGYAVALGRFDT